MRIHRAVRCHLVLCVLLAFCVAAEAQVLSNDFTTDPTAAGWTYDGSAGWSAANGYITAQSSYKKWESPEFAVTPFGYHRVTFRSSAPVTKGYFATVYVNPVATWGRWLASTRGELITDNYTSVMASSSWVDNTYYTRALPNAATGYVRFQGIDSSINIDDVQVEAAAGHAEVATWADSVYAAMPLMDYDAESDRFDFMPRTITKLEAGSTVNIVLLGDSIMNDTSNSAFEVLVERMYAGAQINVITAVGGGTGMDKWNHPESYPTHDLKLQEAVIDQQPDLVMIGGISNGTSYQDIRDVIGKVRDGVDVGFGYEPDIMLMTGAFGANANPLAGGSTWYRDIDPNGTDYRSNLYRIAEDEQTAFLDMMGVWGQYMIDAQGGVYDPDKYDWFFRDSVHANTYGKQVLGRALEEFFTPIPEPATLSLLAVAGLAAIRRRR